MMFIAIMDEDGFVNLASEKNVAHTAIMDLEDTVKALRLLESPDKDSSNPANEGRRIERVQGGWMVLNSAEYRGIATREHEKKLNRDRVRKHRDKSKCNGDVMEANESVMPSEAEAEAILDKKEEYRPSDSGCVSSETLFPDQEKPKKRELTPEEFVAALREPSKPLEQDPIKLKIGSWFNRRPTTKFDEKELKAYKKLDLSSDDDLEVMDQYYGRQRDKSVTDDYRRTNVLTLLNNWNGEVDRAVAWVAEQRAIEDKKNEELVF
jgi:hypothetical protein